MRLGQIFNFEGKTHASDSPPSKKRLAGLSFAGRGERASVLGEYGPIYRVRQNA